LTIKKINRPVETESTESASEEKKSLSTMMFTEQILQSLCTYFLRYFHDLRLSAVFHCQIVSTVFSVFEVIFIMFCMYREIDGDKD